MKNILFYLLLLLSLIACDQNSSDNQVEFNSELISENVSITDIRLRVDNNSSIIREVVLHSFDPSVKGPEVFGISDYIFVDNGEGNDLISNDGIYSATNAEPNYGILKKIGNKQYLSLLGDAIVHENFKHTDKLESVDYERNIDELSQEKGGAFCNLFIWYCT